MEKLLERDEKKENYVKWLFRKGVNSQLYQTPPLIFFFFLRHLSIACWSRKRFLFFVFGYYVLSGNFLLHKSVPGLDGKIQISLLG